MRTSAMHLLKWFAYALVCAVRFNSQLRSSWLFSACWRLHSCYANTDLLHVVFCLVEILACDTTVASAVLGFILTFRTFVSGFRTLLPTIRHLDFDIRSLPQNSFRLRSHRRSLLDQSLPTLSLSQRQARLGLQVPKNGEIPGPFEEYIFPDASFGHWVVIDLISTSESDQFRCMLSEHDVWRCVLKDGCDLGDRVLDVPWEFLPILYCRRFWGRRILGPTVGAIAARNCC